MKLPEATDLCRQVLDEVERSVVGKRQSLELVLTAILANGHVLLEDYPGLAKTLMARSFADVLHLQFARVQFTPDLMPAEVTGAAVFDQRANVFEFRPGPVFTNLLLGDEINRAPPKTQAALLEAMAEGQVTSDGVTRMLPPPFIVLATQNPLEFEGTYPLPEAQLDRFLLRVSVGYPDRDAEREIVARRLSRRTPQVALRQVAGASDVLGMQACVEDVFAAQPLVDYIVDLVAATRSDHAVEIGASPRGTLAVLATARARAVLAGREFATPEDVKQVAVSALAHRLVLRPDQWVRGITPEQVVERCLRTVPAPMPAPETAPSPGP
jgi:MoxR-like ATPase